MLEVNEIPRRDLARLTELIGERGVEHQLQVHRTTLLRWRTGQIQIPGAKHLAIRELLGHLPGTDGKWEGWRFWRGELIAPGGEHYGPGDVLSMGLLRQQLSAQEQTIRALRARLRVLEQAQQTSANEDRRAG